ncbi:prolipoprotein diacylglyceryl transferase [Leptolyngbya sp. 7M]|nr:prolipoprotein diacylglyceryl transferase [Leptolyngbya sp. 7M]
MISHITYRPNFAVRRSTARVTTSSRASGPSSCAPSGKWRSWSSSVDWRRLNLRRPELRPAGYTQFDYFHPTFLYESLWNLGVFALLMTLFFRGLKSEKQLKTGTLFLVYLIGYSMGRFWIEGLRMDSLMLGPLRIAQVVSLVCIAIGGLGLFWLYGRNRPLPDVVTPAEAKRVSSSKPPS